MSSPLSALSALPPELAELREICRSASAVILKHYEARTAAEVKGDGSPVTQADRDAEAIILPRLEALMSGVPAVAEEQHAAGRGPQAGSDRFWLVDPLDGTRHFVERTGDFTINIGLVMDGAPVLGIVCAPIRGAVYIGVLPPFSPQPIALRWDLDAAEPHAIRAHAPGAEEGLRVIFSNQSGDLQALDRYVRQLDTASAHHLGSGLKFARIAEGEFDVFPRFGRSTSEWDTAAGQAILEAAGGQVVTVDGAPLRYGKPGFVNEGFVASGAVSKERLRLPIRPDGLPAKPADAPPAVPRRMAPRA